MKTICTLLLLLGLNLSLYGQTEHENLISAALCHPDIKAYFGSWDTYYILNTELCNPGNTNVSHINTCKKVFIGGKEEMFMRAIDRWIEIREIRLEESMAVVKVFFIKSNSSADIHLSRKDDIWEIRSELTPKS